MNEAIPGNLDHEFNPFGTRGGKNWVPAECDVPLRPGWFYHPEQKGKTKNPEQLFSLYLKSVGRGAGLDLGIAPDSRGLLDEEDVKALEGFGKLVDESFKNNLAQASTLRVSNKRSKSYKGQFLIDGSIDSYWATDDTVKTAQVNLTWTADQTFDLIKMSEYIPLGQRIDSVEVDAMINGSWTKIAAATSIGACKIIYLNEPVKTAQLRIRIAAPVCITMSELGVYKKASL